jgi:predicted nucleotidyltransferase
MRLTGNQIEQIKTIGQGIFGQGVEIYLFGSRVSDAKLGGDIDLLIETDDNQLTTIENKIRFLVKLKMAIGDQKIDLVYPKNLDNRASFRNSILNNRIKLC